VKLVEGSSTDDLMKPVTPSRRTSATDPHGLAITGVPQARTSIITKPNGFQVKFIRILHLTRGATTISGIGVLGEMSGRGSK
jgi:hypothetical protein